MKFNIIILFMIFSIHIQAAKPIVPSMVLSKEEIQKITRLENYFYYKNNEDNFPIWFHTNRQYGSHFLKERTHWLSLDDMIYHILNNGFPIQLRLTELYRARTGIHSRIGELLPSLNLNFNNSTPEIATQSFTGLISFLSPAHWMKLKNQKRLYKATKYILTKDLMDEILKAKLMYYDQHQKITDFEILNYYFIHLQILANNFPNHSRVIDTIKSEFAAQGTDMASQRGNIKLGFDDLALVTALEKLDDDYTVGKLNIKTIKDFPKRVKDLEDVEKIYQDKGTFLKEVVKKSIELKIAKEFHKISKLNIGIAATGGFIKDINATNNPNNINIALNIGYGNLPNILIAKSFAKSAKINVGEEYLTMLDNARRSFDYYTNSLGGFTEASRSIRLNRHALKSNLDYMVQNNIEPDSLLILNIKRLIKSELKLNNALHGSLKARAYMNRFLLIDDTHALKYLPKKNEILKLFTHVKGINLNESKKQKALSNLLINTHKKDKLVKILYKNEKIDLPYTYTSTDINNAFLQNIDSLLNNNMKHYKKHQYYQILKEYIKEQNIDIGFLKRTELDQKTKPLIKRIF